MADELEDYLELRDPKVRKQIAASRADAEDGRYDGQAKLFQS